MAYFRGEKWARPDQSGSRSEHLKLLQTLETSPPCDIMGESHRRSPPSVEPKWARKIVDLPYRYTVDPRLGKSAGKSGACCMFPDLARRTFQVCLTRDFPRARSACSLAVPCSESAFNLAVSALHGHDALLIPPWLSWASQECAGACRLALFWL